VTHDILHDHNGVVHQDANRKDQGEERDAVQRVAVQVEHGEREGERDRDGQEHDQRLAYSQRDRDQEAHGDYRDQHVQ
jgi:hypothetical protein